MIWIASFPRSGNTYLRNILYEVYGLSSSTFHRDADYPLDADYEKFPFVKTHLLPAELLPVDPSLKSVYLVRDGRDAMCSIAHHRKDIVAPGSDYYENLKAAIIAERGSFFGGWSVNAREWIERADLLIRYEDLVADPLTTVERIRSLCNLPEPHLDKLPSFQQMKFGIAEYGSGKNRQLSEVEMKALSEKNFRKGKAGSWKEEMPPDMQELFWSYHGDMMEQLGYSWEGDLKPLNQDLDHNMMVKLGQSPNLHNKPYRVLIESDKLFSPDNDGVKRYQSGLMKALWPLTHNPHPRWQIDLFIKGEIRPLKDCRSLIFTDFNNKDLKARQGDLLLNKTRFQRFEEKLVRAVPKEFVAYLRKKNISGFHRTYDFLRKLLFDAVELLHILMAMIPAGLYQLKEAMLDLLVKNRPRAFDAYDLIHLPLMQHYKTFRKEQKAMVVTMHDLTHRYFPSFHTSINISNAEKGLKFIAKKKPAIIAVSKSTFQDSMKEIRLPADKMHLVYEAAEPEKFNYSINAEDNRKVLAKYHLSEKWPYLLCLSTIEPRKNLANTIKAFTRLLEENPSLDINLVIAGKKGWAAYKLFVNTKLTERIIFTGFIDDDDLSAVYSEAWALCYVSYYEGFGLPPLEAMRCKTPVIYGNNSSMPEIVGEGGLAADADDVNDIMKKMKRICTDEHLRNDLGKKALKQSLNFSWRKAAMETLDVYEKTINQSLK